ncbi:MAG: rod shape-determining protein RodA [Clostridia bacterium]|jgi:rod shape determining protein RodA|nr:rod shape-determining protein RodA [Clostridia bacterium]
MRKKLLKNMDWGVLICVLLLIGVGLVALFSTTQNSEYAEFIKQIKWFAISIPIFILVIIIDYDKILKIAPVLYGASLFLLVLVLFTDPINGASSWFNIGGFSFQPSELGKIALVLFMAYSLNLLQAKNRKEINKIYKLFTVLAIAAVPILLIVKEPDFGTATAYIFATVFILFVSGINKRYIILAILAVAILLPIVYINLPEHALQRIEVYLHPESDPRGSGYNIIQSKLAIGAGQILGMGLLQGNQTQLGYLHPKTTDFIFSAIGEEMGFVVCAAIIIVYVFLITKIVYIAKTAKDNIGSYIAIGIAGILCFHMLENIGMTMGLLPITGVPLPFVSYGGSSLLTNLICIGLVLNISARRQKAIFIE